MHMDVRCTVFDFLRRLKGLSQFQKGIGFMLVKIQSWYALLLMLLTVVLA